MADQVSPTAEVYAVFLDAHARFAEGVGERTITLDLAYAREIARYLRGAGEASESSPAFAVVPLDLLRAGTVSKVGGSVTIAFDGTHEANRLFDLLGGSAVPPR